MLCDLVFEIIAEQLPVKVQEAATSYVVPYVTAEFKKSEIIFSSIEIFVTPNRISMVVQGLDRRINHCAAVKGPKVSATKEVIEGFLRKTGKKIDDLDVRNVDGIDFYYAISSGAVSDLRKDVGSIVLQMLNNFPLQKKMRWGNNVGYWSRPVINILCVMGGEILPISFAGKEANNLTFGNLLISPRRHSVKLVEDYLSFLKDNFVLLERNERLRVILCQVEEETHKGNLQYDKSSRLFVELRGMLEYPQVIVGSVDQNFSCIIPKEVILCVMERHQRYIALSDKNGNIVKFASVVSTANVNVVQSHERVLSARLADAAFLINQDKKHDMDYYVKQLSSIVFREGLGTMLDKVHRVSALAKYVSLWIPHSSMLDIERASLLSKADLATSIVREFPELQGVMGRYYAKLDGESDEVVNAIYEHYRPCSHEDKCPSSPTGVAVSVADKADTLVGLMATEEVSGSRDPFALRKTAIALIRVILENAVNINLNLLVEKSASLYSCNIKSNRKEKKNAFHGMNKTAVVSSVLDFCHNRFRVMMKNMGIEKKIVDEVLHNYHDLLLVKRKAEAIDAYIKTERGKKLMMAYKRASHILLKENKLGTVPSYARCKEKLLDDEYELRLYREIGPCDKEVLGLMKVHDFLGIMDRLFELSEVVNDFMDRVRVYDMNRAKIYQNRLCLISGSVDVFHLYFNFSKI